ncbi:INO80 complex subunit 1 [Teratosphaeria destructans]|uniref:INO80 complex subunit 1 n=1 Tax=Teratosphaeria destructans TaxID=418781 RepID=A0A9W7SMR6_9PEZI|nr:INO80 complex subunit 1 [Teratosphaeria destructans]
MADSPASSLSSELSDVPSIDNLDDDDHRSTAALSRRASVDRSRGEAQPPAKRRKTGQAPSILALSAFDDRAASSAPPDAQLDDDNISLSEDGFSDAPDEPNTHSEWDLNDEAQTQCLWRDCPFGTADNNDDLVAHVQSTHCATGGPKKTKYVCEWGECQRKTSNHPSGYALKAHMRSHTKEKPYFCALPECDKAFTRSDALAKHMRTVHEPEQPRGAAAAAAASAEPSGNKRKIKLSNGTSDDPKYASIWTAGPTEDEDGTPVTPSPANDNITYIPAHHPITGQPGFMIHYPPDINFTTWESSIAADQLMRLLRRQLRWAEQDQAELKREVEALEEERRQEWLKKEVWLEAVMEKELAEAREQGTVDADILAAMQADVEPSKKIPYEPSDPPWRRARPARLPADPPPHDGEDTTMRDADDNETSAPPVDSSPSPPPTGKSGGFDGDAEPFDNFLSDQMASFNRIKAQREKEKSAQNTPLKQQEAEADAAGALVGMSGGPS